MMDFPDELSEAHHTGEFMLYAVFGVQVASTLLQLVWEARSHSRIMQLSDKTNATITLITALRKERMVFSDSSVC